MASQIVSRENSVRDQVSPAEWQARVELAAGHRVLAHYGVDDVTYNHFGLQVPGEPGHMLIKLTTSSLFALAAQITTAICNGRPRPTH
jgi:hypothetical protein